MTVRTRFAPSPTGSLHVGGARTALYCLLHARHADDGRFLLRIEDTDQVRSTDEAAAGILRDLRWLGLIWDEGPDADAGTGPYFQSQRLALYDRYVEQLLAEGKAFEAWDTPEELKAERDAAEAAKQNYRYTRKVWTDTPEALRAAGRRPVVRLARPTRDITVDDLVLGPVTLTADDHDDLVIRKADGFPTYHFAVVVDDHHMGVTLVLRGQEHLMNTHKHVAIYDALGWSVPAHAHLPLIFNPIGAKMSKRDKAKTAREAARTAAQARGAGKDWTWLADATGLPVAEVAGFGEKKHDGVATAEKIAAFLGVKLPMIEVMDYRRGGYLPEALLNYLALLGWSPGDDRELLTVDELIASWDLGRVNKTPARFDPKKLEWVNAETIKRATLARLTEAHASYLEVRPDSRFTGMDDARRAAFLALYQPRMQTFDDLESATAFFFAAPTAWDEKAVQKFLRADDGLARLGLVGERLAGLPDWEVATLSAALDGLAAELGVKIGQVAQPLRVALTGTTVSPQMPETLALLGRDETLARIAACRGALGT